MAQTIEEMKAWIDTASYKELLRKWRRGPIGSPWFRGEVFGHFQRTLAIRRAATSPGDQWAASRAIASVCPKRHFTPDDKKGK